MFDTTGLFAGGPAPNPSAFYSTEIAARKGFIESVVMQLTSVVSRKIHGSAGTFDVDLPETGKAGIECRSGGASDDYTLVFTFANNVIVQGATVFTGVGMVTSFSVAGKTVTVNLTEVVSAQRIVVALVGVSDGTNTSDVQATMDVLVGDTNANGQINSTDTSLVQAQSGQPVTSSNFRDDVNANGLINSSDVALVQSKSGTGLPAASAPTAIETSAPNFLIEPLPVIEPKQRSWWLPSRSQIPQRPRH
jgi:Dockerin type I domain